MRRRIMRRIRGVLSPHDWQEIERIGNVATDRCRWCGKTRTKVREGSGVGPWAGRQPRNPPQGVS